MTPETPSPRDFKGSLNPAALGALIATTNPRYRAFTALLARTGIRISEAVQIQASDVDFQRAVLTILRLKEKSSKNGGRITIE